MQKAMLCPECGSSKTEFINHPFTEIIRRKNTTSISNGKGVDLKIQFNHNKTEGEDNTSSTNIPRENGYTCKDCGRAFLENADTIISGYKILIAEQFISDYQRLTVKSDLVEFFKELNNKLPKRMTKLLKDERRSSGTYQFTMEIIISGLKYSLTCEIDFENTKGINMEGVVRKK